MITKELNWISVKERYPNSEEDDAQVLTYTPGFRRSQFRIMSGEFVQKCNEVEYWARVPIPKYIRPFSVEE